MAGGRIRHDRVKAIEVLMQYPLGFVELWHEEIVEPPRKPRKDRLRLALSEQEAQQIGEQFLRLAASIREFGGSKH